jgi:hypothetical protein
MTRAQVLEPLVLLARRERAICMATADGLSASGIRVIEVTSTDEALSYLECRSTLRHTAVATPRYHRSGVARHAHAEPGADRDFPARAVRFLICRGAGACHVGSLLSTCLRDTAALGACHYPGLSKTITLDT